MNATQTLPLNQIVQGNVMSVLRTFPNGSIDSVITSPPYWGLRHYGTHQQVWGGDDACQHVWQAPALSQIALSRKESALSGAICSKCDAWRGELGLEPYFGQFIKHLCLVFDEIRRVLKPTGTCWVNLGDTYASKGTPASRWAGAGKKSPAHSGRGRTSEVSAKSLCQIPSRFAIEMTNRGWILRNEIIWHKPNCIPASVDDRFTVDFDKVYFFTKAQQYFFEMQYEALKSGAMTANLPTEEGVHIGRNKRVVWTIPLQGFKGAHFATYPARLVETPLLSGCPEFVCRRCGQPRDKIREVTYENCANADGKLLSGRNSKDRKAQFQTLGFTFEHKANRIIRDVGYSDCGCKAGFDPGVVLDPFMGSGTTALVALKNRRNFVGIELNPEYVAIAERRIALWRECREGAEE